MNLSTRQAEIFALLRKGFRQKEIASALRISVRTVESQIHRAARKLKAESTMEAVILTVRVYTDGKARTGKYYRAKK